MQEWASPQSPRQKPLRLHLLCAEVCRVLNAVGLHLTHFIIRSIYARREIISTDKTKRIRTSGSETRCGEAFPQCHPPGWIKTVLLRCRAAAIKKLFRTTALRSHLSEVHSHPRVSQPAWLFQQSLKARTCTYKCHNHTNISLWATDADVK